MRDKIPGETVAGLSISGYTAAIVIGSIVLLVLIRGGFRGYLS